ncbi:hypothetical protein BDV93DRAFT_563731 [Ceratobasidium sp. AG-I]|nr:hypothetical protein BDV93DRAFT_563731 [Ceratobasidium sp. AG-I]
MSNYCRDSFSNRDVDDYSDYQPGNNRRDNRGQPPIYRDDRPDYGAEVCNRRCKYCACQPTMEENLVSLALLNARNKRDHTRYTLINRGSRLFHPVRRGTCDGARRHGHGGPPRAPPYGDDPGPAPNVDARRAFPQAMNPNRRGPIVATPEWEAPGKFDNKGIKSRGSIQGCDTGQSGFPGPSRRSSPERGQSSKRSRGQTGVSPGHGPHDHQRGDRVHDQTEGSVSECEPTERGGGGAYTQSYETSRSNGNEYRHRQGSSRDDDIDDHLERLNIRGSIAGSERRGTLTADRPSLNARFLELRELLQFYDRFLTRALSGPTVNPNSPIVPGPKGRAPMMAYDTVNEMEDFAEPGLTEALEEQFIDYDAGAAGGVEPEADGGSDTRVIDVEMSEQASVAACEPQRFVSPKDLELKPKGKEVSEPGSSHKRQRKGKGRESDAGEGEGR